MLKKAGTMPRDALSVAFARSRAIVAQWFSRRVPAGPDTPLLTAQPFRDEILSTGQLEEHAQELARAHEVTRRSGSARPLLQALLQDERILQRAYRVLAEDARLRRSVTPAAEWLLDNFYVVLDQIREIRQDLPLGYYHQLPRLTSGSLTGYPRVYAIAIELIAHTDGRIDLEQLIRFVQAYQSVAHLTMGELWAIPIMLRVGLVENLGRLASLTLDARQMRIEADVWADRLLTEQYTGDIANNPVLRTLTQQYPRLLLPFAVQLLRRLRSQDGEQNVGEIITWLEQQPVIPYDTAEALVHAEYHRQAANQVSVGNTITSMRTLGAIDWANWFERVSRVEQILREDPADVYARSTFATRDRYRHVVEELARHSNHDEADVARRVLALALHAPAEQSLRQAHIGYYLIDAGRAHLEAQLDYHAPVAEVVQRGLMRHPTEFYLGAMAGGMTALLAAGLSATRLSWRSPAGRAAVALMALPAAALVKSLVDHTVTRMLPPRLLPRLDLEDGIPADLRTIVVVPILLLTPDSVQGRLDALEVLFLANRDPHLHFALLSDFADAPAAEMPEDANLLAVAAERVEQLNARYGADRFLFLHRRRQWNARQGVYMGWERKRGKLEEFNHLLDVAQDTSFTTMLGDLTVLDKIRYVITLDADTQLPRDSAHKLIGTLAHPLNQAVIDPHTRRVVDGYGILQPRIGIDPPSATVSRFARIFSNNVGIDPYTTAVSDVYMDLFGSGIYAGKGIYDPQVLREVLHMRFPDNTLLSHDLIEGSYARTALLSDVELLDNYPATYAAAAARQHRWVRGDWQISAWVAPWTPEGDGGWQPNVLPVLARFQIFDNLRRSLTPAGSVALLLGGWLYLPGNPAVWTILATAHLALPLLFDLLDALDGLTQPIGKIARLRATAESLRMNALRAALNLIFLPDQAWLNLDAISRTLIRLLITRRNLLEWETAAQAEARLQQSHSHLLIRMAPVLASGATMTYWHAERLKQFWPTGLPIASVWLSAPLVAAWLDRPWLRPVAPLADTDRLLLRELARSTWAYFEQFVNEDGNYLAPDNFQETPNPLVAYRTSPTNIGLQLLADLAAYDFGYIGICELTARTECVLQTIERLEHFQGHLLNWYDTQTLKPLPPAYVSTVDSGNLVGALIVLRQGYLGLLDRPIAGPWIRDGLRDTLTLLAAELPAAEHGPIKALEHRLALPLESVAAYRQLLGEVVAQVEQMRSNGVETPWIDRLDKQASSQLDDLNSLASMIAGDGHIPTLAEIAGMQDHTSHATICTLLERHTAISRWAAEQINNMQFGFLYDDMRCLFAIGYSVADGRRDSSYYDLLASEARLASFLEIARGELPQEHWFHLGRAISADSTGATLVSWSGTMFEYLMPLLFMRTYTDTLLDITCRNVVARQIAYAQKQGIPWGISESAFNARDLAMNYQYRAFGVPGLGLKSGLADDLVIAPYATMLALPILPQAAVDNVRTLIELGMRGEYGLYEAADYTEERLPPGTKYAIVRAYMVHHQGMSLLALANVLNNNVMRDRFHAEPMVQATELLLQERIPHAAPIEQPRQAAETHVIEVATTPSTRQFTTPYTAIPYTHLLSNGTYTVMVTNAGGSASFYNDLAITRWQSDTTRDHRGTFCYIRDVRSNALWSPTYMPTRQALQGYQVTYSPDKAEFSGQAMGIETRMEIVVSPEDNAEIRRITINNLTSAPRELELTSYAEVVLAAASADQAHPAFSNLFVETEFVPEHTALLASRRPRAADATRLWMVHVVAVRGHTSGAPQYETDRAAFIGRGRDLDAPQALYQPLTGSIGPVLDPIVSLRRRIRIVPGGSVQVIFTTAIADTRDNALHLAAKYHEPGAATRALEMAWTQSQVELRYLNIGTDEAHRFQRMATYAIYMDNLKRAKPEVLQRNTKGQPRLWSYGISGDYPIILVHIGDNHELSLVQELLLAHQYWRLKRLMVDLVILNEDATGYTQGLQDQILTLIRSGRASSLLNTNGGIFVLRTDTMPEEDYILLQTVARAILHGRRGDLAQHLRRREPDYASPPAHSPLMVPEMFEPLPDQDLLLQTRYGGFTHDGREFVINLTPEIQTPAPWINVIANQNFGCIVSERGSGYTWSENSRENRLTPWSNDPVRDPGGEALYLRNETSGLIWSPVPYPAGEGHFRVRHGFGYTTFEHRRQHVESTLTLYVALEEPVKFYHLKLRNTATQSIRLSATFYVEWVLGVFREQMAPFVISDYDAEAHVLLAHNAYNSEFGERVAFLAASDEVTSYTGNRTTFIGRNGDLRRPVGMISQELDGQAGAGRDPCGALRVAFELAPGEEHELIFLLGQSHDHDSALELAQRLRAPAEASVAYQQVVQHWNETLGVLQVQTPRPEIDVLLNGWMLYQTLACRIWARSAFYQSGGAYGFRDQLQDVMALVYARPELVRKHMLRAAARQFVEGDVQHWWHPPTGRGIRTNFSDDYLWLPFVTAHYIVVTGDLAVLDEELPFLKSPLLEEGIDERYEVPTVSSQVGTLYEHCIRAIDYGLKRMGEHGLPLMGSGDWNDGMNLVGHEGRGESVWVGWFLRSNLQQIAGLCESRGDIAHAERYRRESERLAQVLEQHAWDGAWYLRAFFDDGTPLGSASSEECKIDSLTQSWAIISGAANSKRAHQGMAAVQEHLVDPEAGLIKLFTPPFDKSPHNPGYIKGYVPGVRENGGQYTHAAIWVIWAYAILGDGQRAGELFDLINPIRHAMADPERYKVEPYTIAADVYAVPPHTGRGGWTWYTGSAGWMYRLGIEMILGLRRSGDRLEIVPCVPADWGEYTLRYRYGNTLYTIHVANSGGAAGLMIDGKPVADGVILLRDDGAEHRVEVKIEG